MALTDAQLNKLTGGNVKPVAEKDKIKKQAPTQKAPETRKESFMKKLLKDVAKETVRPFLKAGVTGYKGLKGAGQLLMGDVQGAGRTIDEPVDFGFFGEIEPARTMVEGIGTGLSIGANFAGGGAAKATGKTLIKRQLAKGLATGAKGGFATGVLAGAGEALEKGKGAIETGVRTAVGGLLGTATGGVLGGAGVGLRIASSPIKTITQNVAPFLEGMAEKIESTLIGASKKDYSKGFEAKNVLKYGLAGDLNTTFKKTTEMLDKLNAQAKKLREGNEKVISIEEIMNDVVDTVKKDKDKYFNSMQNMNKAFVNYVKEFEINAPDGKLTVPGAQKIKEAVGVHGSWLKGQLDPEMDAMEKISNVLYNKLKVAIEQNSKGGLKEINKKMSELIPIKNAIVSRIPVAARSKAISFTDILTSSAALSNPKGWGLFILNKLSKSGKFAGKSYEASQKLKATGEAAEKVIDKGKEKVKEVITNLIK